MSTVVSPRAPAGAVRRLVPAPGPDDSKPRAGSAQTESRSATLTTDTPPLPTTTRTSRQRLLATRPGKSACRPAATRPLQMSSRRGNRSGGGIPGGRPRDDRDQAGLWPIQTAAGFRQAAGQRRAGALSRVSICRGRVSCSKKTVAIRSRQATCKLLNRLWLIINVASCPLTRNAVSSRNCAAIAGNPAIAVKYVSTRRLVAWFFLISTNR